MAVAGSLLRSVIPKSRIGGIPAAPMLPFASYATTCATTSSSAIACIIPGSPNGRLGTNRPECLKHSVRSSKEEELGFARHGFTHHVPQVHQQASCPSAAESAWVLKGSSAPAVSPLANRILESRIRGDCGSKRTVTPLWQFWSQAKVVSPPPSPLCRHGPKSSASVQNKAWAI